jgi:hypothetical protein
MTWSLYFTFIYRCCDGRGCRRSYHLSCLDPPLEDVPLGVWHCVACIKKKMESGVHSVSEGVESIWDEREVDASDVNRMGKILYNSGFLSIFCLIFDRCSTIMLLIVFESLA